ncbi:hypothetical protein LCM20_03215 [Halobacillus litoralis]|uniref:hypothetical protein n=1 Tax=Halobacillus litoralis TaxID=45668 RepID=UPI001CD4E4B0|nr:hypothetical protein [Halobacillus litoralis]MCA0969601.1 hypothetical protein [Halobacillus litoralis]
MIITVNPSFHWIGYHLTANLLQEGVSVIGIDSLTSERSEQLYMFVGRNSNFQHFYNQEDKEQHIHIEDDEISIVYEQNELFIEQSGALLAHLTLPIVYGEWMDLPDHEISNEDELYEWVREREAVYIGDYVKKAFPQVVSKHLPPALDMENEGQLRRNVHEVWKTIQSENSFDFKGI